MYVQVHVHVHAQLRAYSPELVLSIVVNPLNAALAPHKGQNLLTLSKSADYYCIWKLCTK